VQIYERVNLHVTPELYIWRDDLVCGRLATHPANASACRNSSALAGRGAGVAPFEPENVTGAPFILREALAASRILTNSSPRRPFVSGSEFVLMQSIKCWQAIFRGSSCWRYGM